MEEIYTVIRIDDPDFGCEGIPDGTVPMATVYLKDEAGNEKIMKEKDGWLYECNIAEGDRVFYKEGSLCKVLKRQV
ncbi:MAG TPA: hypothetical protein DCW90_15060 [Lachnospiraceae bacterium]|nr:hypothetical protein [uncultured Lachnoclostridium sp.]HAU86755.1 hypothetical protein [Lachnospiraceae bacterium]